MLSGVASRGPNGTGVSDAAPLPAAVGPETNQAWSAEVPFGRSSPAVASDRLFLTAVEGDRLATMAFDRSNGQLIWKRSFERPRTESMYPDTDSATPSPATDGENVFVFFQEFGVVSYSQDGTERWRVPLGPFRNYYGTVASPVLVDGQVIQVCDQAEGSFVVALDASTGQETWRQDRSGRLESYATPIVYPSVESPSAVLVLGSRWIDAYHPKTGESLWSVPGLGSGPVASLVLVGDTVFTSATEHAENGWPEFSSMTQDHDSNGDGLLAPEEVAEVWLYKHFGWLDADGDGTISQADWTHIGEEITNDNWGVYALRLDGTNERNVLWNYRSNVPYIPTPVAYRGVLYLVKDDILTALDMESGEVVKKGRLGSGGSKVYASPVAGDGKVFIGTLDGDLLVLDAENEWQVSETNALGGAIWATPAIADGHLYVRTDSHVFDFAVVPAESASDAANEEETEAR